MITANPMTHTPAPPPRPLPSSEGSLAERSVDVLWDAVREPATYGRAGAGTRVHYRVSESPVGHLLVAGTAKGLCAVRIGGSAEDLVDELRRELHRAELVESPEWVEVWMGALVDYLEGSRAWPALPVDVRATAFQARVWTALRRVPAGTTLTYAELARRIGQPGAARAVGGACAANPVALAVPCHRIVPRDGGAGGYRWGGRVKRALLAMETSPELPDDAQAPPSSP